MKKARFSLCLLFLFAPISVLAYGPPGPPRDRNIIHHHTGAPEMPALGFGVAVVIGVLGYLVLRRNHSSQN